MINFEEKINKWIIKITILCRGQKNSVRDRKNCSRKKSTWTMCSGWEQRSRASSTWLKTLSTSSVRLSNRCKSSTDNRWHAAFINCYFWNRVFHNTRKIRRNFIILLTLIDQLMSKNNLEFDDYLYLQLISFLIKS